MLQFTLEDGSFFIPPIVVDVKMGEVWMTHSGERVQISVMHGGYTDCGFQVRKAGSEHNWPMADSELDYKIS